MTVAGGDRAPMLPPEGRVRRILLSAYACDPLRGSEAGGGWNWALHLALAGQDVTVLTRSTGRANIDAALRRASLPNLRFVYVDAPPLSTRLARLYGSWYLDYLRWQSEALVPAAALHGHVPFDLVLHVSWGNLHLGSRLWRLGAPLVFGPAGGGQVAPPHFSRYLGRGAAMERLRTAIVRHVSTRWLFGRSTAAHAALVFVTNNETARFARALGARHIAFLPDSGIPEDFIGAPQEHAPDAALSPLRLIWVGSLYPWKACLLALDAVAAAKRRVPVRLTIVGDGPQRGELEQAAARMGLGEDVRWEGWVPWQEMPSRYAGHHALLFTSLRESFGMQMLEGLGQGLPVIALDHQGPHVLIGPDCGIKVPVGTPAETVQAFATAICALAGDPERLSRMSRRAVEVAREHTWQRKIAEALRLIASAPEADTTARSVAGSAPVRRGLASPHPAPR